RRNATEGNGGNRHDDEHQEPELLSHCPILREQSTPSSVGQRQRLSKQRCSGSVSIRVRRLKRKWPLPRSWGHFSARRTNEWRSVRKDRLHGSHMGVETVTERGR